MSSSHPFCPSPLLLTGAVHSPEDPRIFASLFVDSLRFAAIPWSALEEFHRNHPATPIDWPRSLAESRLMLTLAVAMNNLFGDQPACRDVTLTLTYHLADRAPHDDLVALVRATFT